MWVFKRRNQLRWPLLLSACSLIGAVFLLEHKVQQRADIQWQLRQTDINKAAVEQELQTSRKRQLLQQKLMQLQMFANENSYLPYLWGERQLSYSRVRLSRTEANQMLQLVRSNERQWARLDNFELAVIRQNLGLFEKPVRPEDGQVVFTAQGLQHFSLQGGM